LGVATKFFRFMEDNLTKHKIKELRALVSEGDRVVVDGSRDGNVVANDVGRELDRCRKRTAARATKQRRRGPPALKRQTAIHNVYGHGQAERGQSRDQPDPVHHALAEQHRAPRGRGDHRPPLTERERSPAAAYSGHQGGDDQRAGAHAGSRPGRGGEAGAWSTLRKFTVAR